MLIEQFTSYIEDEAPAASGVDHSRRHFMKIGAAVGGGLLLGFRLPGFGGEAFAANAFAPNAYIRIDRDGTIAFVVAQVEMGQGTFTSMPMLIAEELEVDLSQVRVDQAPPDDKLYANPLLGFQATGGSTSVRALWKPRLSAGVVARTLVIMAGADTWGVDPASLYAEKGEVIDKTSGRKLAYGALAEKAASYPVPDEVPLKDPKDYKLVGTAAKRVDTPTKVNGVTKYGIDTLLPGMKFAAVAACPTFGGKLKSVDDSKATAVNGVRQIVKLDDVVAVIADHNGAARKGLAALNIVWDDGPNAAVTTADIIAQMAQAAKTAGVVAAKAGDAPKAIASAARKLEAVYHQPFLAHAAMEPMNCTVHVRKDDCEIWVGTQVITRAQAAAAKITGLPLEKVQVHNHMLGGGFGRRLDEDGIAQAVKIAKQVDGPVKVVWSREEDTQHDVYRPYYYDVLAAGLDDDGNVVGFSHRVVGSSILARWAPPLFKDGLDFDAVEGASGPYTFPNLLVDYVRHEPPSGMMTGWWRGVGMTHNAFMVEGFIDELAVAAKKDPVEFRRGLLGNAPRAKAVLDLAAEKAGWGSPMPAGKGRGVSVIFGFGSYLAQIAEVGVDKDGTVHVERIVAAFDCGRQVNTDTLQAQIQGGSIFGITAALYGEITIKDGRVEQGNFDTYQLLRINEAPKIEVYLVNSREAPGGAGEPATSGIAAAVVNAVFAATGKRLRKLPIDANALKSA